MSDKTYRAGIIGLGFIGGADQVSGDALGQQVANMDGTHFSAYANHSRVALVAGCSRDEGRRQRFEERAGANTYPDWRVMLEEERLDIVSVATYAPQHAEITIACAERGIPAILCEKPIATRMADAERMLAACRDADSLLVINHQRRFKDSFRRLRRFIADGGLGELTSIYTQWPNGRLGNVGTHMIDALQMITSREAVAVCGHLDLAGKPDCRGPEFADPGGWGMIRFEGGLSGFVNASDYGFAEALISVIGTEGRVEVDRTAVNLTLRDGRKQTWPQADPEGTGMDRAVADIVDHLDGSAAFPYKADEAARTLETIIGFHASHARGGAWTKLPLEGRDREISVNSG
jgi:predicted dehydrogenase